MYARLQTSRAATNPPAESRARLVDTIAGHPGFNGLYLVEHVDGGSGALLTLWHTREDARRASERTAAQLGPRPLTLDSDDVYEVAFDWQGTASGERPGAASIFWFDGPLSDERVAAARRAIAGVPGMVRALDLWDPATRSAVTVSFATSPEVLDAGETALLPDATRIDIYRVVFAEIAGRASARHRDFPEQDPATTLEGASS
jgi:hypothetical protein